ncbi:MAG: Lipopolysaccharide export system ATP-binding protein LptB [Chlamydiia bacterium]|nr:Lipopolysaccharide export system ATP-binding protein LptB [Chlamydiia bacterium]
MGSMLKVRKLKKIYSHRPVVSDLELDIHPGEVVGLLGPNGAGKTTTFHMIMGLVRPNSGQIIFKDEDVTQLAIEERAARGLGYLAQEPSIFRSLTVEDNLLCVLETLGLSKKEQYKKLDEALKELDLSPLRKSKSSVLSGGERRRLEITRALLTNPSLILLDEPFAGVDPLSITEMKKLILILKKKGISILIIDHNAREIFTIVDRCYLIKDGTNLAFGTPEALIANEKARAFYLGDTFSAATA